MKVHGIQRDAPSRRRPVKALGICRAFFVLLCSLLMTLNTQAIRCLDVFTEQQNNKPQTLAQKATFLLTLAAGTLTPMAVLAAGGFGGVGGGGGVATFKYVIDANRVRSNIRENEPIPPESWARARIQTLDGWEMEQNGMKKFATEPGADWQQILAIAHKNLELVSPIMAKQVRQVSEWMAFGEWKETEQLPILKDATPEKNLHPMHVQIQLALRLSEGNNLRSQGPAQGKVDLKVVFNKPLFDRMDPFEQAMLVFHEQMYALAQAKGYNSSDKFRSFVQIFFSDSILRINSKSENGSRLFKESAELKHFLARYFGDYVMFFADQAQLAPGNPRTAQRHLFVFQELIRELRDVVKDCMKYGRSSHDCSTLAQFQFSLRKDVSPEKAFLFLTFFFLEKRMGAINAEALLNENLSPVEFNQLMEKACKLMVQHKNSLTSDAVIMKSAQLYCR